MMVVRGTRAVSTVLPLLVVVLYLESACGFSFSNNNFWLTTPLNIGGGSSGNNNNNNNKPPRRPFDNHDNNDDDDDDDHQNPLVLLCSSSVVVATTSALPPTSTADQITTHTKNLLARTLQYWRDRAGEVTRALKRSLKKEEEEEEDPATAHLRTTKISSLTAPNSTLLTPALLQYAGQRADVLGKVLSTGGVQRLARVIAREVYQRRHYPLCSVTGATLTEDGECRLQVEEPTVHREPVAVAFAKEMVVDDRDGTTLSFRKYREKRERRREVSSFKPLKREDLNTTFVQTTGKTRSNAVAGAMALKEGEVFQWDADRWKKVVDSGIWDKVLHMEPVRLEDGTVQLRVICQESPRRRVEYGISKSLYTGGWEGELDFENRNLLGGGEVLSVTMKRGARDPEPSVTLRYQDDKFGRPHGYAVEAFQDYIGPDKEKQQQQKEDATGSSDYDGAEVDDNPLLTRQGVTVRLSTTPLSFLQRSSASASVERVKTVSGGQEDVGSTTWKLGPVVRDLGSSARHSVLTTVTTGLRASLRSMRPYTAGTVLARQVFPFVSNNQDDPVAELALRHAVTTSTHHLPRHEANAAGIAARVRGYTNDSNGAISTAVGGTTEVRFPLEVRRLGKAKVVFFADWLLAQPQPNNNSINYGGAADDFDSDVSEGDVGGVVRGGAALSSLGESLSFFRKGSIGVGLRKNVQGIPVKCDFSLTKDGKVGSFVSIGKDFDVL